MVESIDRYKNSRVKFNKEEESLTNEKTKEHCQKSGKDVNDWIEKGMFQIRKKRMYF